MEEYPSNSKVAVKTEPAADRNGRVQQITTGKVIVKKPSLGKRFAAAFTGEDGRSIFVGILHEVLIPAGRDMVADAGREALDRAIYGESRGPRRPTNYAAVSSLGSTLASRVNYAAVRPGFMTDPRERQQEQKKSQMITRGSVNIDDIILSSRVEADEVISRLHSLTQQYGQATVADLFDLVGVTGQYTDEKFGWLTMDGARPHRTGQGFMLDLPRPIQLD